MEEAVMSTTVAPEKILKELAALWADSGKQSQAEGGSSVLRACSMTLLVLAEAAEDAQDFGETVAALMPEHPARTILVRLSGPGERSLTERVYSQCWMPFGQRRQICCEQVELTVSDAGLPDLQSVVLPLTVADVPLIVWCRAPRLLGTPPFLALAGMATKVVFDSSTAPDPAALLQRACAAAGRGMILGDLSWTMLTRWREMLSQVFENRQNLSQIARISSIEVKWGGARYVPALYLGAWVRDSLAAAGLNAELKIVRAAEDNLLCLRLSGEGVAVEVARDADRMMVTLNGSSNCTNLSQPTDYRLMREELSIVRHDPIFEKTLTTAARLAHPIEA
jgi:glucose-6-phosphate dehydrogenase assembly protein OpcA